MLGGKGGLPPKILYSAIVENAAHHTVHVEAVYTAGDKTKHTQPIAIAPGHKHHFAEEDYTEGTVVFAYGITNFKVHYYGCY
jgi:hypothetical protein